MPFANLGLSQPLTQAIETLGYSDPTHIQTRAIPAILRGDDLIVAAQTGTVQPQVLYCLCLKD